MIDRTEKKKTIKLNPFLFGPYISIIGGLALVMAGFAELTCDFYFELGFIILLRIGAFMAIGLGMFACFGGYLALKDYKVGKYLILFCGIIAIIGSFIQVGYAWDCPYLCICPVYLVATNYCIEPFIILSGGVITFYYSKLEKRKRRNK